MSASRLGEILERLAVTGQPTGDDIRWLLDENAKLRGQRDEVLQQLEDLVASTHELHEIAQAEHDSERCEWCKAEVALKEMHEAE